MKRNLDRTPEEISSRRLKAKELWLARQKRKLLKMVDRVREEQPTLFARLICQGILGLPLEDSGLVLFSEDMNNYKGEPSGTHFSYLAELILQRINKKQQKLDAPYISLASWIELDTDFDIDRFPRNPYGVDFRSLNGTAGSYTLYVSHVRWTFFDNAAESLNYSVMKSARMVYRGVPLFERYMENGEYFPVAEDAEDYVYLRQKGKRDEVTTGYNLPDWTKCYFVKSEHIRLHDAVFFSDWDLSPEELELRRSVLTLQCGTPGKVNRNAWPWGDHETVLLRKLSSAAREWWSTYDPENPATAPTNETVRAWIESQGVAKRVAEVMAQILRGDGLATGPRK